MRAAQRHFLAIVSHELRTPLTALLGFLQLHIRQVTSDGNPRLRQSAERALQQARLLARDVEELLDLDRVERGSLRLDLSEFDLRELVHETLAAASGLDPARDFLANVPDHPVLLEGDKDRIQAVLLNLLTNAVKYSAPGSPVEVRLEERDGWASLEVRDHGGGISREDLPRIFAQFFRGAEATDTVPGGMGIGLYISRAAAHAHGGDLDVQSEKGAGSTFTLRLPIRRSDAASPTGPVVSEP